MQEDIGNKMRVEYYNHRLTSLTTDDVEAKTAFHEKRTSTFDINNTFFAFFRARTAMASTQLEIDICVIQAEFWVSRTITRPKVPKHAFYSYTRQD